MTFAGSNQQTFDYMQDADLSPTGQRIYINDVNFPATSFNPDPVTGKSTWPVLTDPDENPDDTSDTDAPITAHACVSIRPDLDKLLGGQLDAALNDFLSSAPGGPTSLLGLWHEASPGPKGCGPDGVYQNYFNSLGGNDAAASKLTQAEAYVQALAHNYNVKVGVIDVVGITDALAQTWFARNLDFYACDIYDNATCDATPYTMLGAFKNVCNNRVDSHAATIGVTETNSRCSGRRPWWFQTVWSWLQTRGFTSNTSCFLTFWRLNAPESGGWLPNDTATISALNKIFSQSSP